MTMTDKVKLLYVPSGAVKQCPEFELFACLFLDKCLHANSVLTQCTSNVII